MAQWRTTSKGTPFRHTHSWQSNPDILSLCFTLPSFVLHMFQFLIFRFLLLRILYKLQWLIKKQMLVHFLYGSSCFPETVYEKEGKKDLWGFFTPVNVSRAGQTQDSQGTFQFGPLFDLEPLWRPCFFDEACRYGLAPANSSWQLILSSGHIPDFNMLSVTQLFTLWTDLVSRSGGRNEDVNHNL